jgi:hypothetical protein
MIDKRLKFHHKFNITEDMWINPGEYIPDGMYCYTYRDDEYYPCPFHNHNAEEEDQNDGYCAYLNMGDWMDKSSGLLWDQIKDCNINDSWEEQDA